MPLPHFAPNSGSPTSTHRGLHESWYMFFDPMPGISPYAVAYVPRRVPADMAELKPEAVRISDWMRFWAPEVKRRIDHGETLFAEVRDAYQAVRATPADDAVLKACLDKMEECRVELDKAPPGAYDHLSHIGTYIP